MSRQCVLPQFLLCFCAIVMPAANLCAHEDAQALFDRGYRLQTRAGDLEAAIATFEQIIADSAAAEELREEALQRLVECREDLVSADLAQVMPPDALAHVAINQPGRFLQQIASQLGMLAASNGPHGFDRFTVSPHLFNALKKSQGLAITITSIESGGMPNGLIALHTGDDELLRGILETAARALEPTEAIGGFKTYCIQDRILITPTARLILASPSRDLLTDAVGRLQGAGNSLADQDNYIEAFRECTDAALFGYVAGPQLFELLQSGSTLR